MQCYAEHDIVVEMGPNLSLLVCLSVSPSVTYIVSRRLNISSIRYDTIVEFNVDSKAEYTA